MPEKIRKNIKSVVYIITTILKCNLKTDQFYICKTWYLGSSISINW